MLRRWLSLGCSCLVGVVAGVVFIFLVSNLSVRAIQFLAQVPSNGESMTVTVQEDYLNSAAGKQVNGHYATGVNGLTLTTLQIDAKPGNELDLHAQFNINIGFISFDTTAGITNRLSAQDGKIVINMEGRPQLGNITVPIDLLPFNLSDAITNAIDRVDNEIIVRNLNDVLQANLTGTDLYLESITTDETSLTLHLHQK